MRALLKHVLITAAAAVFCLVVLAGLILTMYLSWGS